MTNSRGKIFKFRNNYLHTKKIEIKFKQTKKSYSQIPKKSKQNLIQNPNKSQSLEFFIYLDSLDNEKEKKNSVKCS